MTSGCEVGQGKVRIGQKHARLSAENKFMVLSFETDSP